MFFLKPSKHITHRLCLLVIIFFTIIDSSYSQGLKINKLGVRQKIDSAFMLKNKDFPKARIISNQALDEARTNGSKPELNFALYKVASLDWLDGHHEEAIEKSRKCLALSRELNDTTTIANTLSLIGLAYLYTSSYDSSIYYFKKSLFYFAEIKDTTQVIKNLGFTGLVYSIQGNYWEAKKNLLKTVVLKRQYVTSNWDVLNLSSDKELSKAYYNESLINAKTELKRFENNEELSNGFRDAYHNVALVYLKLDYPDSALIYFKKSAEAARRIGEHVYWNEQSRAYQSLNFYDSAIVCNKKALEISLKYGTRISIANGYGHLGTSYLLKKEYHNSIEAFKKSIALHGKMGHLNAKMEMMLSLCESLVGQNKIDVAISYVDSALMIARSIKSDKGIAKGLKEKALLLKINNDYKEAIAVKEEYDLVNLRLQEGQVQLKLATLDLYNKLELSELEISDLNKHQALSRANLFNRTLVMVIVIIVSAFIVLFLIFNYNRTKKLKSLNNSLNQQKDVISSQNIELYESNKEKELLLGEIHHRVKNNLQTITSLLSIQQRKLKDPESIKVLEDSKNRVMAMGLIHQHIYQDSNFAEIDFKNYIKELLSILISANATCEIKVECNIPALNIGLDNAIFFGLIINELAINSIKHAYDGVKNPLLSISIFEEPEKTALVIKDNGIKENINFDKKNSFGWKMINTIASKLDAKIIIDHSDGLSVKVLFTKDILSVK